MVSCSFRVSIESLLYSFFVATPLLYPIFRLCAITQLLDFSNRRLESGCWLYPAGSCVICRRREIPQALFSLFVFFYTQKKQHPFAHLPRPDDVQTDAAASTTRWQFLLNCVYYTTSGSAMQAPYRQAAAVSRRAVHPALPVRMPRQFC